MGKIEITIRMFLTSIKEANLSETIEKKLF